MKGHLLFGSRDSEQPFALLEVLLRRVATQLMVSHSVCDLPLKPVLFFPFLHPLFLLTGFAGVPGRKAGEEMNSCSAFRLTRITNEIIIHLPLERASRLRLIPDVADSNIPSISRTSVAEDCEAARTCRRERN